ncbi:MAG: acyl-CoA dehydrogenase family protein [Actinomycetota bacterium]|nr:acyl-CoA dehydrogenase family protein [Actinomycetota bacterium]
MHFGHDDATQELVRRLQSFMDEHVYPNERTFEEQERRNEAAGRTFETPAIMADLKTEARARGLWNLFLTHSDRGAGLTNVQYAPIAELAGRSVHVAPEAINCSAPDTGNMEVLDMFGTPEQQARWLEPLLAGEIRSGFAMTEPDVASSDATNIATRIERVGDSYIINGRKWWTSGAMNPRCAIFIVMGKTDPQADRHHQQSMVLVPRDTPGVTIVRPLETYGYLDGGIGGHGEVHFVDVRVPASNLIGHEGDGFAMAQARLGPGRIHHCMRLIGMAERSLELMCQRATRRTTFGAPLSERGVILEWAAQARIRIEQARLLVLRAAWLIDTQGAKAAHADIQAIKIAVPAMATDVIDRAVQTFGAAGVSQDFPLAFFWAHARTLHLADGPDEVHLRALGRREMRQHNPG